VSALLEIVGEQHPDGEEKKKKKTAQPKLMEKKESQPTLDQHGTLGQTSLHLWACICDCSWPPAAPNTDLLCYHHYDKNRELQHNRLGVKHFATVCQQRYQPSEKHQI
jgi:hypothetical protein